MIQVFKVLYDNASNSFHVGAHLAILIAIRDVCKLVVKELTSWVWSSLKLFVPNGIAFWNPFIFFTLFKFFLVLDFFIDIHTYIYIYIYIYIYSH